MQYTTAVKLLAMRKLTELGLGYIYKVASMIKCSERTLWRWRALYDGTVESLQAKPSVPLTSPRKHTAVEHAAIVELLTKCPTIGHAQLLGKLRRHIGYTRHYGTLWNYIKRNNLRAQKPKKYYKPKPYHTPLMIGQKWQIDVKEVPRVCAKGVAKNNKHYQYSIIDEASRQSFIYNYIEHSGYSTTDFIEKAIKFFGYKPILIQSDNGREFVNDKYGKNKTEKLHRVELLLNSLNIGFKQIRAYTPRHNGKIESLHRRNQMWLYDNFEFSTQEQLTAALRQHNAECNDTPSSAIWNKDRTKNWLTPNDKRKELVLQLKQKMHELGYSHIDPQHAIYLYAQWQEQERLKAEQEGLSA
ncbi:MAG: DDE-type integrase/transposase/recombinase [Firmicutes bacterium]|nr:DDE-type integrase/transposase/recombinase [Bacillota bacterium]